MLTHRRIMPAPGRSYRLSKHLIPELSPVLRDERIRYEICRAEASLSSMCMHSSGEMFIAGKEPNVETSLLLILRLVVDQYSCVRTVGAVRKETQSPERL
jgi:hypothetical protein